MPMSAVDRIRAMQAGGQFGAKTIADALSRSAPSPYGQPSGSLHDKIQQDFSDSMAPKLQPMLPPDSDLNTPVAYNPITGSGYVQSPKRRM